MNPPVETPAIFLDRDGVIVLGCGDYVVAWNQVHILDGVHAGLQKLSTLGYKLIIVSNQSAVGRGIMREDTMWAIHTKIVQILQDAGHPIHASYICQHHPNTHCACRKPCLGMFYQAQEDFNIDLNQSWLIDDQLENLLSIQALGVSSVLVRSSQSQSGVLEARNLDEAADTILRAVR